MNGFDLSLLNPPQKEAVMHREGPLLILAGAGTGKTRVITCRIARMIEKGIPPQQILAVTFTNKAAKEMRERVTSMLPGNPKQEDRPLPTVCTFHSLCLRILRRDISALGLGYKNNFAICSGADQVGLIRKIITRKAAKNEKLDPGAALGLISRARNAGLPHPESSTTLLGEVAIAYREELKKLGVVDFDDLLVYAGLLLEEHQEVRDYWSDHFRYIMVDEFQDTNSLQMKLLRRLAGEQHNVAVVGDDDQSIYGWRGAEISNILDFETFFPNPTIIKLEQNYRSTTPILHTANSLIQLNKGRRPKSLWSESNAGNPVRVLRMPDDKEEARWVASEIFTGKSRDRRPYEDYAVLFRTNRQSMNFEQEMRARKIPYRVIGGMSFFDRREVRDLLAYLSFLLNNRDDTSLLRIINNPPRGIGDKTIEKATEHSIAMQGSIWESLISPVFQSELAPKAASAITAFVEMVEEYSIRAQDSSSSLPEMIGELLASTGYPDYLRRTCREREEADLRVENLSMLRESAGKYTGKKNGLREFLDSITLDDEDDDDIESKTGVCLITLHASKGLEFPIVYLVGLEDGTLPHKRSVEEGTLDEERRLLYVGITRAREQLAISWCMNRDKYGQKEARLPSSFLEELDPTHVVEEDYAGQMQEQATGDDAADWLSEMKSMLES